MDITKFIAKSCIVEEMKSRNKADVLKELTSHLFDKKRMKNPGPALDQIMAREATESTGIGNGIAVPHARISGMKNLACAVGRVKKGLDFLAMDRKPVHLVFLICYPPVQQTTYLNFVATVSRLLSDGEHLQAILDAESQEGIHGILSEVSMTFEANHEAAVRRLKTDPAIKRVKGGHVDIILLARLQLHQETLAASKSGKGKMKAKIEGVRSLVEPRILKHYDRLTPSRAPALVPVEGDTCQGCFIKLPSKFVQQVRQDV